MSLQGEVQSRQVTMLVNLGSSHCFVSESFAHLIGGCQAIPDSNSGVYCQWRTTEMHQRIPSLSVDCSRQHILHQLQSIANGLL